jgi:signal peptidase I
MSADGKRSIGHKVAVGLACLLGILLVPGPFIVRTFVAQPFSMPSGSMEPTLLIGDHFFVSKFAYGYTHYSLPFSWPAFSGRIFAAEPQRGDVVVFRLPKDDRVDYVKRVIGLPGDRVQMIDGAVHLNGTQVKRERVDDYVGESSCGAGIARIKRWKETLSNGASYETLDCQDNGFLDNTPVYTVPAGHYFTLGDNRDNSTDSRVLGQVGYIPADHLIGRVTMIFYSVDGQSNLRSDRIGLSPR